MYNGLNPETKQGVFVAQVDGAFWHASLNFEIMMWQWLPPRTSFVYEKLLIVSIITCF